MQDISTGYAGTLGRLRYPGKPRLIAVEPAQERPEIDAIVETVSQGTLGHDKQDRDRIVHAFCGAAQVCGSDGERMLLEEINCGLVMAGSGFRVRFGDLLAFTPGARAMEIVDGRINHVVDRMIFGIVVAANVVPFACR